MDDMISCCGLACSACDAFLATRNNDEKKKEEVARLWSQQFHMDFRPGDISCDGCRSAGGRLSGYCRTCAIRQCARDKGAATCASCGGYDACEKIAQFHALAPEARERLNELRSKA